MHIILGATGHVGSSVAKALLERNEPVTVVLHSDRTATEWRRRGAKIAVADVFDVEALRRVIAVGKRLFVLNPPAPPDADTAAQERESVKRIVQAIDGAPLEKIVALSTYGARPGDRVGDLGVLYELEQALRAHAVPATIVRAAYFMSNWDAARETATAEGVVHTLYPVDFAIPMVAPDDVGRFAARLMTAPTSREDVRGHVRFVEGPEAYSAADVACAFEAALRRPVRASTTPRAEWTKALGEMGFSQAAMASFIAMTEVTLASKNLSPPSPERGPTTIEAYVAQLVDAPRGR